MPREYSRLRRLRVERAALPASPPLSPDPAAPIDPFDLFEPDPGRRASPAIRVAPGPEQAGALPPGSGAPLSEGGEASTGPVGSPERRKRRNWLFLYGLCLLVGVAGALVCIGWTGRAVRARAAGRIRTVETAPRRRVAIVFGARVYRRGGVSRAVGVRLRAALALYRSGRVARILVSGDHGRTTYNEPDTMRRWLVANGVRPADVRCDYAGFRTLDTCARARLVWNLDRAILVTQRFHLPRALYLADAFGLDAVGVAADGPTGWSARPRDRWREPLARMLAWIDVRILDRGPRFLGPFERI